MLAGPDMSGPSMQPCGLTAIAVATPRCGCVQAGDHEGAGRWPSLPTGLEWHGARPAQFSIAATQSVHTVISSKTMFALSSTLLLLTLLSYPASGSAVCVPCAQSLKPHPHVQHA